MKKFRKLTAMVTALAMAGCMMTTMSMMSVSAEDAAVDTFKDTTNGNTISMNTTDTTYTYKIYQVFSGDAIDNGSTTLTNIAWGDSVSETNQSNLLAALKSAAWTTKYTVTTANDTTVSFTSCQTAQDVAEMMAHIDSNSNDANQLARIVGQYVEGYVQIDATTTSVKVEDGYYIVKGTNGSGDTAQTSLNMLYVVGTDNASLIPKIGAPEVLKKVKEDNHTVDNYANANANDLGTLDTQVKEDNTTLTGITNLWNDVADYDIGDPVPFKLYGSMPENYDKYDHYYYEFQDTLGAEFNAPNNTDVKVYVDGTEITEGFTVTVTSSTDNASGENGNGYKDDKNHINIVFTDTKNTASINEDSIITVEYSATLNENAVIGLNGQENAVKLVYSNNPNNTGDGQSKPEDTGETPEDKVIVFTYELDITKVNESDEYLKDAKFLLYTSKTKDSDDTDIGDKLLTVYEKVYKDDEADTYNTHKGEYSLIKGEDEDGVYKWVIANTTDNPLITTNATTSTEQGKIIIRGLDDGTYYLAEEEAPQGYNKLKGLITLEIDSNTKNIQTWTGTPSDALTTFTNGYNSETPSSGLRLLTTMPNEDAKVTYSYNAGENANGDDVGTNGAVETKIVNKAGSTLPSTGGIGTTIFYVTGGILVVGAGVTLIAKKRMKNNEQ